MTAPAPFPADAVRMIEDCVGCKWTLHVLGQIRRGVTRPGALERSAAGLTAKVLAERLTKLVRYGVVERRAYPEIPPRVEYTLTAFGERLARAIDAVGEVQQDMPAGPRPE